MRLTALRRKKHGSGSTRTKSPYELHAVGKYFGDQVCLTINAFATSIFSQNVVSDEQWQAHVGRIGDQSASFLAFANRSQLHHSNNDRRLEGPIRPSSRCESLQSLPFGVAF
jgi:hypothetical protein